MTAHTYVSLCEDRNIQLTASIVDFEEDMRRMEPNVDSGTHERSDL